MASSPRTLRALLLVAPGLALARGVGAEALLAGARAAAGRPPATLYRQYCAGCHGDDHRGKDLRAQGQYVPDFTRADWHAHRDDHRLLVSILDGKGSRMPSFRDQLTDAEARALVAHLREFGPARKQQPPAAASDDFATRYAALEKEFEELRKQFHELSRQARKP